MNLSLESIQAFLMLAETLSFSQAAKALSVSQSSVSRQIKTLEETVGCQLFLRDTHHVSLTEQGRTLQEKLRLGYGQIQAAVQELQERDPVLKGKITIGTLDGFGRSLVTPAMLAFQKKHPSLMFDIRFMDSAHLIEDVKCGRLDLALAPVLINTESLRCFTIFEEEVVLVTRAENKKTFSDYDAKAPAPFIMYRPNDYLVEEYLRQYRSRMKLQHWMPYVMVNSHQSMIQFLLESDSYCVMPYHALRRQFDEKRVRQAHDDVMMNTFYLIHPAVSHEERRVKECKRHLMDYFKNLKKLA